MSAPEDRLPPEVDELRRADQAVPGPSAQMEREILARLQRTLVLPPVAATSDDGRAGQATAPPPSIPGGAATRARTLVTLLVGATVGAGAHEVFDRMAERRPAPPVAVSPASPPVERAAVQGAPGAGQEPAPAPAPPVSAPPSSRNPGSRRVPEPVGEVKAAPPEAVRDRDLAAERALIEQARTALSREQAEPALEVLAKHGRKFPRGTLAEERESLRVQVLVRLERYEEARAVGARFHDRFPASIFGAVVDEVLRSIPEP